MQAFATSGQPHVMHTPMLTAAQQAAFTPLFRHIAAHDLATRWLALLAGKPSKWHKVQPWRCWPGDLYRNWPARMPWITMAHEAQAHARHAGIQTWHGLACGHSLPEAVSLPPDAMAAWMDDLMEGFVSVIPNRLALIKNHEGGQWLWMHAALNPAPQPWPDGTPSPHQGAGPLGVMSIRRSR